MGAVGANKGNNATVDKSTIPPNKDALMWQISSFEDALKYVRNNKAFQQQLLSNISKGDKLTIQNVINGGFAEDLQTDSDVAEQFIEAYKKAAKKSWE